MRTFPLSPLVVVAAGASAILLGAPGAAPTAPREPAEPRVASFRPPLAFEPNVGQTADAVRFVARADVGNVYLTPAEAVVVTRGEKPTAVRMRWDGARPDPAIDAGPRLAGTSSYFSGSDASAWRAGVPRHASVTYRELYAGIDLVCRGNPDRLEYDFVVAPGASPNRIGLAFSGHESISVDPAGDLVLGTGGGEMRHAKPVAFQDGPEGRDAVAAAWRLRDDGTAGFDVGTFDRSRPLVVDPTVLWCSYLGGAAHDSGEAIAVGPDGSVYVAGYTDSVSDFPTTAGALREDHAGAGGWDSFVTRFTADGSDVLFSTYVGGGGQEFTLGIAVDDLGDSYLVGETYAVSQFPVTPGAFQTTYGGGVSDLFVAKLSADGTALRWATFLGGTGEDGGAAPDHFYRRADVAVGPGRSVYVCGTTTSADFPTQSAAQGTVGGSADAVLARIAADGASLHFSTYLGGSQIEIGYGLATDPAGDVLVTGVSASSNFPSLNPLQSDAGLEDAFLAKYSQSGAMQWSTLLGGPDYDDAVDVATDASGAAYVVGTSGPGFPTTPGAFRTSSGVLSASFVTKVNAAGNQVVWSTLLFPNSGVNGVAVDAQGRTHAVGVAAEGIPSVEPVQPAGGGGSDAFLTVLAPDGGSLVWSTPFGGSGRDEANAVDVRGGALHVTGTTFPNAGSVPFPATDGAFQSVAGGNGDGWVAKIQGPDDGSGGGGGGGGGDPGFVTSKGSLTDSAKAGKDKAKVKGTFPKVGATFDPTLLSAEIRVGNPADPLVVTILAADGRWKGRNGKWQWKSGKGATPKTLLKIDAVKGSFSVDLSKFDFPAAPGTTVVVFVEAGGEIGNQTLTFEDKGGGKMTYKP